MFPLVLLGRMWEMRMHVRWCFRRMKRWNETKEIMLVRKETASSRVHVQFKHGSVRGFYSSWIGDAHYIDWLILVCCYWQHQMDKPSCKACQVKLKGWCRSEIILEIGNKIAMLKLKSGSFLSQTQNDFSHMRSAVVWLLLKMLYIYTEVLFGIYTDQA